ncbi:MAG: hypothetical protein MZV70_65875 [Desulfobacterales bacterium]|nr:hypothetical protein [Desulfobacterales bacterium]
MPLIPPSLMSTTAMSTGVRGKDGQAVFGRRRRQCNETGITEMVGEERLNDMFIINDEDPLGMYLRGFFLLVFVYIFHILSMCDLRVPGKRTHPADIAVFNIGYFKGDLTAT